MATHTLILWSKLRNQILICSIHLLKLRRSDGTEFGTFLKNKTMKKSILFLTVACSLLLANCSVVGGIFKAGMVWGILLVVLIVGGIIALIARGGKK